MFTMNSFLKEHLPGRHRLGLVDVFMILDVTSADGDALTPLPHTDLGLIYCTRVRNAPYAGEQPYRAVGP